MAPIGPQACRRTMGAASAAIEVQELHRDRSRDGLKRPAALILPRRATEDRPTAVREALPAVADLAHRARRVAQQADAYASRAVARALPA